MANFWKSINKPILALAPMAGITDRAFRQMCKGFGADVVYSEMASATALVYNPLKTLEMLASDKNEQPYVVQLFGSNPDHFAQAVKLLTDKKKIQKLKATSYQLPAGIDINFGCPVKKVAKQGAGAVLMDKPELAREIIKAVFDNTDLPVSIKIRSKVGGTDALSLLDYLTDLPIAAVMIHGRTLAQGHSGPVDHQLIKEARNHFGGVILANGGVNDRETALQLLQKTGADGIGIGQGALGRPWVFQNVKCQMSNVKGRAEIFKITLQHARLSNQLKGQTGIIEMRKHLCWYVTGLPDASALRRQLVTVSSLKEIERIFDIAG